MERFKIKKQEPNDDNFVFRANTTQECYDFLLKQDMGLYSFFVECIADEIEIDADEFMSAFRDGECPEDLQFF